MNVEKAIIDILKMTEYYRTEGKPDYSYIDNMYIKKNIAEIYEMVDFFENYIVNYHLYVYDILRQEFFVKLLKNKKINGLDVILEEKLNEIKKNTKNEKIHEKIDYIKLNSYKINSIKKLAELIKLLHRNLVYLIKIQLYN